jgi:mannose-6-phosphate isomerase-like protein (cupin superfamily)
LVGGKESEMILRNWRDQTPYVGHDNAIVHPLLRSESAEEATRERVGDEACCLRRMGGIVKHTIQGRKSSDHHSHENIEQIYYILKGEGTVLVGEERRKVREGDVVYLPPKVPHQLFNDGDDWIENLIISCPLD